VTFAGVFALAPSGQPVTVAAPTAASAGEATPGPGGVFYLYCADALAAGASPLRVGKPGYRPALDRDGDGVACESWNGPD
jgi:hypothetical protein